MKRTKIVCTIGPASGKASTLRSMMKAGMNVTRQNFSHGTHASHKKLMLAIRSAAKKTGQPITMLADLQGPKIRLGNLPEGGVKLKNRSEIVFTTATNKFSEGILPVTYKRLHQDVKKGQRILIDDGLIETIVTGVRGQVVRAQVINGGVVTSHKGMNLPDSKLKISSITLPST